MAKINPHIKFQSRKKSAVSQEEMIAMIHQGDRFAISKAITLIESDKKEDFELSELLISELQKSNKTSFRIGISGPPGAGKSTLIEALGLQFLKQDKKPAILAIDPSSKKTKGSILGDKTRMPLLSKSTSAFIRPSAAGETLGGVARKTRESMYILEAAGYDPVIVETVGVGQSETTVRSMTDLFILLISPGAGDEIQGIKRGIMELADIIVVNKLDGELESAGNKSVQQIRNIVKLITPATNGWECRVTGISALRGRGISDLVNLISEFESYIRSGGVMEQTRKKQDLQWYEDQILKQLSDRIFSLPSFKAKYDILKEKVISGDLSPFNAANQLLSFIEKSILE